MKVTIVGAGNMGRGIGTRAVAGGHDVEIADRDPEQARVLAEELGGSTTAVGADGPVGGEVVVFAGYYPGIKDAVREYADRLAGKVVVDITNPVNTETWNDLATPPGTLARVGLLERKQQRDRVEYRIGASALRIIQAAGEGRSIPFARVEDQEADVNSPPLVRRPRSRLRAAWGRG